MKDGVLGFECTLGTVSFVARNGMLSIELDHPWAGDSDIGFGQVLRDTLTPDKVESLIAFLVAK